jgi:hypothetical protein
MISCSVMISSAKVCVASHRTHKNMGRTIALMLLSGLASWNLGQQAAPSTVGRPGCGYSARSATTDRWPSYIGTTKGGLDAIFSHKE